MTIDARTETVARLAAALRWMSRRGVVAELVERVEGTRGARILHIGSGTRARKEVDLLPYAVFREAQDAGWLVPADGDGLRWSLSHAARRHMRRLMSAGAGPPAPDAGADRTSTPVPITLDEAVTRAPVHDPAESPLAWLRRHRDKQRRPLISALQLEAGERLRADLWIAQMSPRVTLNWAGIGGAGTGGAPGGDVRDSIAAAQQRVRRAMTSVSPVSAGLLLDVCGHLLRLEQVERDRCWPARSGKIALQMALSELARHYRLPGCEVNDTGVAARLRHWGAEGFRPAADTDTG